MVTIEAMEQGLAQYLDNEILPNLPRDGVKGFGIGVAATLLVKRGGGMMRELANNKIIQGMGIMAPDGAVDLDALREACVQNIPQTGLQIELPMGIALRFRTEDIDKMCAYIKGVAK
jgi:hypothetical protein